MSSAVALDPLEYILFAVLTTASIGLGLYFSFSKKHGDGTTDEMFLGKRSMPMFPLAVSVLATMMSALGLIGFAAHFYAYGIHLVWSVPTMFITLPLVTHVITPVLYRLRVTSVFEYLRLRYGNKLGVIACVFYFFFGQSLGALAVHASSLAVSTVFHVPLLWSSLVIGLAGTVYTALGGLRSVVWTDCMQTVIILSGLATIFIKVGFDSFFKPRRPFSFQDLKPYFFNAIFDVTEDENIWANLIGLSAMCLFRNGIDQAAVQRYLAARTLKDARRTAWYGTSMINGYFLLTCILSLVMAYWYRDCDPELSGEIDTHDQIIPFYVVRNLASVPGFSGLFLSGIVGATTSTTSSIINSLAAICYIDIVSQSFKITETSSKQVTKGIAFAIGILMTLYATIIPYMGSSSRVLMMLQGCVTGPFVGLFLMALMFPCINTKVGYTS
ncbi:unnamed protein product [Ixodes hexagonus]